MEKGKMEDGEWKMEDGEGKMENGEFRITWEGKGWEMENVKGKIMYPCS